jgi:hypothetical protein
VPLAGFIGVSIVVEYFLDVGAIPVDGRRLIFVEGLGGVLGNALINPMRSND